MHYEPEHLIETEGLGMCFRHPVFCFPSLRKFAAGLNNLIFFEGCDIVGLLYFLSLTKWVKNLKCLSLKRIFMLESLLKVKHEATDVIFPNKRFS